ncbi:MAG: nucleotidyltransferase domain-containing protein [Thiohalospira sp.]
MRLSQDEIKAIKETIQSFDSEAKIWLYGSRVDNHKRGGDIDLLIFSQTLNFSDKLKIKSQLYKKIGEQKIDLLIAKDDRKPFVRIALENAILL